MSRPDPRNSIRAGQKGFWEKSWADDNYSPDWRGRGIAPEIVGAMEEGWLPETGSVLDIGCGEGEIAAWFNGRGYKALGIDVASRAVELARHKHVTSANEGSLQFLQVDITELAPPDLSYNLVIDRGCLHSIQPALVPLYVQHIARVCSPDARMLLFAAAFRGAMKFNDPRELAARARAVSNIFRGVFQLISATATNIGETAGQTDAKWLPGVVFRLERV